MHLELKHARELAELVDAILDWDGVGDWDFHGTTAYDFAKRIGAHSVARAIWWYMSPEAWEENGDHCVWTRLQRVMGNYLRRVELAAVADWHTTRRENV